MKLAAPDVSALHDGRELPAVVAGRRDVRGVDALRPEGMDEVDPRLIPQAVEQTT